MASALALAAHDRPRLTLGLLGVLVALAVWTASGLGVDTDSSRMLDPDLPFQSRAQALNQAFPGIKNTVLVVVRSPHRDAADATAGALVAALAAEPGAVARAFSPAADPFLVGHGLLYDDISDLRATLDRLGQSSNLIAALRAGQTLPGFLEALDRAMLQAAGGGGDPAALGPLMQAAADVFESATAGVPRPFDWAGVLEEGRGDVTRVVTVEPVLDYARLNPARPALEAVAVAVAGLDPSLTALVEIGVTGDPALRAEELSSVTATLPVSLGLSLLLVAAILWLALGRAARVGLALAAVLLTLVLTAGAAGAVVGALNLVSVAFVVLMVGLGIDFAIHLLAHLDEDRGRGLATRAALAASTRSIGGALLLSAATTALAFLAFTTTAFIGMAQLGMIGAAGVLIACLVAMTLIPAATALVPSLAVGRGPLGVPTPRAGGRQALAIGALAIGAAAALFAPAARFDADPMGLRNAAAPSVVAYGWLGEAPGASPLRLSLLAGDAQTAAASAATAEALDEVASASWLDDLVPADQDAKLDELDLAWPSLDYAVNGEPVALTEAPGGDIVPRLAAYDAPGAARLGAAIAAWREGAAAVPPVEAALFRFFPALIDRLALVMEAGPVAAADLPPVLRERFVAPDGRLRVDIAPAGDMDDPVARAAFVDAVAAALPEAGGPPAQVEGAARAVGGAMAQAVALALAATAIAALLVLRSALMVGAILAPLALAAAVTLAASVLLDLPFNYANVIVLPLMIGIGVDTGIHIAVRAGRTGTASAGDGPAGGVFATSTPRAALASALTTIGAFGTLALSDHAGTASMGVMLVIALAASVAMIFALTPPMVERVARRQVPATETAAGGD
ncbi:MAG: MMPL family transporter [Pseudomonadota bacterium]